MELLNQIVSTLGVSEDQAAGGTGLLMKLVKDNLGGGDFQKVLGAEPQLSSLMEQAPDSGGGLMGMAGGLLSSMGNDKLAGFAEIAGGLQKLGLEKETLMQFAPLVLNYFQQQDKGDIASLIQKALPF